LERTRLDRGGAYPYAAPPRQLPANGVGASAARFPSLRDVLDEKVTWQVSAFAYIRRLHQLDLVTDWQYRSLVIEASAAGYRRAEGDIAAESSQIWTKIKTMLHDDGIGLTEISAELAVPVVDLRGLIFSPFALLMGSGRGGPAARHLTAL
jgi:hypothetical protein